MVKCKYISGRDNVCSFLNDLQRKGSNVSMNIISITQDGSCYTIFYIDIFDEDD